MSFDLPFRKNPLLLPYSVLLKLYNTELLRGGQDVPTDLDNFWKNTNKELSESDQKLFTKTHNSSTYGYLTKDGLKMIIQKYKENSNETDPSVFYDLGSGLGMPIINAALLIPGLKKAFGIELSKSRHDEATRVLASITSKYPDARKVELHNGDITSSLFNYGNADMIFISNLCMSAEINEKIASKLNQELKPGTQLFMSQAIPTLHCRVHDQFSVPMSWTNNGNINYYIV